MGDVRRGFFLEESLSVLTKKVEQTTNPEVRSREESTSSRRNAFILRITCSRKGTFSAIILDRKNRALERV